MYSSCQTHTGIHLFYVFAHLFAVTSFSRDAENGGFAKTQHYRGGCYGTKIEAKTRQT